jgi:cysteinyl-tRNA synthetase
MSITIYNTLTRSKQPFTTIEPNKVTMYCCGVTVYDDCHLGHARSYIGWDVVRRYLQWRGYQVRYVQNFTDIDDKILNRAKAENRSMEAIVDRYIAAYFTDIRRLNILDADEYPRVTEHIPAIHDLIQALEAKGYAYAVDGDVYYNVRQFEEYGKLSGRKLEQMQAGAGGRVDPNDPESKKQDPFDFALWKAAKPSEPAWDSPWGKGRPGWHIECSAMIRARLGETIDIHGGGGDTEMAITAAENGWQTIKDALTLDWQKFDLEFELNSGDFDANAIDQFQKVMDDDFNTAAGLAVLFELAKSLKREFNLRCYESFQELSEIQLRQKSQTLIHLTQVFGLEVQAQSPSELEVDPVWIESMLQQRQQARQEKRYAESDYLR